MTEKFVYEHALTVSLTDSIVRAAYKGYPDTFIDTLLTTIYDAAHEINFPFIEEILDEEDADLRLLAVPLSTIPESVLATDLEIRDRRQLVAILPHTGIRQYPNAIIVCSAPARPGTAHHYGFTFNTATNLDILDNTGFPIHIDDVDPHAIVTNLLARRVNLN